MRGAAAILLTVLLLLASAQAPFLHDHPADPGHRHARGITHAHLTKAAAAGPALTAAGDEVAARWLDWVASANDHRDPPLAASDPTVAARIQLAAAGAAPEVAVRSHDPPPRSPLQPRAPPV